MNKISQKKWLFQIFITFLFLLIGFTLAPIVASAISVNVQNGVVGLSIPITTSIIAPNTPLHIQVIKPDNAVIHLSGVTGSDGILKTELDKFHTSNSGTYRVSAKPESGDLFGPESIFILYPGDTSTSRSEARLSELRVKADGVSQSVLVVNLKDSFGNNIPDRQVSVISSRSDDIISPIGSNKTDQKGIVNFSIRSTSPGQSILTITDITKIDLRDQQKYVLFSRPSLTFIQASPDNSSSSSSLFDSLRNSLFTDLSSNTKAVKFTLEIPNKIVVNEFSDIKLRVETPDGLPARDYRGTVLFSSNDPNADLPLEDTGFTFSGREASPGEQIFARSVKFSSVGIKQISVTDVDRPDIETSINVEVVAELQNTLPEGTAVQILSPTDNSTLGTKNLKILGKALPNSNVGIFVDSIENSKILTDAIGNFEFNLDNLNEGSHTILVKLYDGQNQVLLESNQVRVTIDTEPAKINLINISPEGNISPNTQMTIGINSEPNLTSVRINIGQFVYTMQEVSGSAGTYTISFPAPESGSYPISFTLIDKNGNQSKVDGNKSLNVININLPNISEFQVLEIKKESTKLSWKVSFPQSEPSNYAFEAEITKPDNTKQTFKSQDKANFMEITGLEGDKSYSVKIRAVVDGNTGPYSEVQTFTTKKDMAFENVKTDVIGSTIKLSWSLSDTSGIDSLLLSYGVKGQSMVIKRPLSTETTSFEFDDLIPGLAFYAKLEGIKSGLPIISSEEISLSGFSNQIVSVSDDVLGRGLCVPGEVTNLKTMAGPDGKNYLYWDILPYVDYYEVHIGSKPGLDDLGTYTVKSVPFPVPFIDNNQQFNYFSVKSGCSYRKLIGEKLSSSLKVDTGPALWLLLGTLVLSIIGGNYYYSKDRS